jgi:low affinity Fe/Cu permease
MQALFRKMSHKTSEWMGSSWSFMLAVAVIVVWAVTGPIFHYSDSWQLIINTGTTIITFLMVFLIQNTQNREAVATQIKLDELIRAVKGARTRLVHLEECTDEELLELQEEFKKLHERLDRHRAGSKHPDGDAHDTQTRHPTIELGKGKSSPY